MKYLSILALAVLLNGCASNPSGSSWATADFNKYDKTKKTKKQRGQATLNNGSQWVRR